MNASTHTGQTRAIQWGNFGLSFLGDDGRVVGSLALYAPIDPTTSYEAICRAWIERGEMPAGTQANDDYQFALAKEYAGALGFEVSEWGGGLSVTGRRHGKIATLGILHAGLSGNYANHYRASYRFKDGSVHHFQGNKAEAVRFACRKVYGVLEGLV